jgi:hypothetical protein
MKRALLFVLTVMAVSLVAASSHEAVDVGEAVTVKSELGAEIRLLQLSNAVERAIIIGEETKRHLNDTTNTSPLDGPLGDLYGLNETLTSYTPENLSPEAYLALKDVARNATSTFKSQAQPFLDGRDQARIKAAASPRIRRANQDRRSEVQSLIAEYNERSYQEVVRDAGLNASTSDEPPRKRLEEQLQRLPEQARRRVSAEIRERSVREQVKVQRDENQRRAVRSQVARQVQKNKPAAPRANRGRGRPSGDAVNAYVEEQQEAIQNAVNKPENEGANSQGPGRSPPTPPGRR